MLCWVRIMTEHKKTALIIEDGPKGNERKIKLCDDYSIAHIGYIVKEGKTMIDTHTSITDINLSVRTLNLLMRDGINTVGDYLAKRDELAVLYPLKVKEADKCLDEYKDSERIIEYISVDKIKPHPDNPRKDVGDVSELAESIKQNGIMQNLTVIPTDNGEYMALIGHRRLAAAKAAGLDKVPCVVVGNLSRSEQVSIMLAENMQRSDLTVMEQVDGMQMMLDLGDTVSTISKKTGMSETTVRRRLSIAEYNHDEVKSSFDRGATLADYDEIKKIRDKDKRNELVKTFGTVNYDWQLKRALDDQKNEDFKKRAIDFLQPFATPIENVVDMQYVYCYYSSSSAELKLPEKYDSSRNYYYIERNFGVELYTDYTTAELEAKEQRKTASEQVQQKAAERRERAGRLDKICEDMCASRIEFMRNFKELPQKKAVDKLCVIYDINSIVTSVANSEDGYIESFKPADIMRDLYPDQKPAEVIGNNAMISPDKQLIVTLLAIIDAFDDISAHTWQADYEYNANLTGTYKVLALLGYQISDVEQSILDGTNELYYKEDGQNANNKD